MRTVSILLLMLALCAALSACGNKGDLVRPSAQAGSATG
jgi:predicted small lipoprotein YifL